MIRAVRQLLGEFPDLLYVAIGDGEERADLQRLIETEGVQENVRLAGEIDDRGLIASYQQCDLFILPNRQVNQDIEGFGMVLLEAQACAKPVIAGASGGTAEAMDAPATGRIAACETPDGIVPVVAELLRDRCLRQTMGQRGREWAVANFEWSSLAQQAREVFESFHPARA
jgi:phosphatidylinositol alpha-1,6-mannosyltransferase